MTEKTQDTEQQRILVMKGLIKGLSMGLNSNDIRRRFHEILKDATPEEISIAENELIAEGTSKAEIERVHDELISIIKSPNGHRQPLPPAGHPIHILMVEHEQLLSVLNDIAKLILKIRNIGNIAESKNDYQKLIELTNKLDQIESHYQREEIVLFAYLEKHGLSGPPKALWAEHDEMRKMEKNLITIIKHAESVDFRQFISDLETAADYLLTRLRSHVNKEDNILFEAAMRLINDLEWIEIRNQFDEIGYMGITPESAVTPLKGQKELDTSFVAEGGFVADTGELSAEQLEMIFNTLPFDITYIDEDDTVVYFNEPDNQIFPRTKASIGRKVQNCHPEKSVNLVNKILGDFKSGEKNMVAFWIDMNGRMIYIRYFAVRDREGKYMGCMEVTQDITLIKQLSGEKRLLD